MVADPKTRKAIAQRAIDHAAVALLSEWVQCEIEFKEMRERYLDLLALQAAERQARWMSGIGRHGMVSPDEPSDEKNGPAETAAHEVWRS